VFRKVLNVNNTQKMHPCWEELAAFDLGRLSDKEWTAVAAHVACCDTCSSLLDTTPRDGFVALLSESATSPTTSSAGSATPESTNSTSASAPPRPSCEVPSILAAHPRYRVLGSLGSGGIGVVFKAEHILMDRLVALKVLQPGLLLQPMAADRFCREVRALARLTHPNIVTAFDAEQVGNVLFLVMEYVEGESLDRILRRCGKLPVALVCAWIRQVAMGLQFAYDQGVIHRDLKPANLLLTAQGQVKILDFGLARLLGETAGAPGRTPDGSVVGTPTYVAPEQARDPKSADIRADLYSLGCTWYEMLAGRPPFPDGTLLQQLLAHQDQTPRPMTDFRTDVPAEINAILSRLLEKDLEKRFQTPAELLDALENESASRSFAPQAPRGSIGHRLGTAIGAAGFILVLLLGAGWYWFQYGQNANTQVEVDNKQVSKSGGLPKEKHPATKFLKPEPEKRRSTRDQAVAWLTANNTLGPASPMVDDNGRQLDAKLVKGKAFMLRLGAKLVKSGRPTILAGREYDFFSFELPDGIPRIADLTTSLAVTAEQSQEFHPDQPLRLSRLEVDQKLNLNGDQEVTGSIAYQTRAAVVGRLSCRFTFMLGTSTRTYYWLLEKDRLEGEGVLPFAFDALFFDANRRTGPAILFFDVCSLNDPSSKAKALVLSNTCAEMVIVQDVKAKK
jgi:serine/threonine protein kinase